MKGGVAVDEPGGPGRRGKKKPVLGRTGSIMLFLALFGCNSLFLDTGALAAPAALEVKFGATYAAYFVQIDGFDIGGEQGEGPFHAYSVGDLPYGEGGGMASALAFDHISLEALDTLLVAFNDLIIDSDIITGFELRKLSFSCQLLVYKSYSSVHNFIF